MELEPCRHMTCVSQGVSGGGGCQDESVVGCVELEPWRHMTCVFQGVSGGAKTRLGMGRGRRLEKMSKQKLHAPEYEAKKQQRQQQQDEADSETVRTHLHLSHT